MNRLLSITALLLLVLIGQHTLLSQDIRINEVVASNSVLQDEDGDSPDWIELHNFGDESISMTGMTLTDDLTEPDKWTFGELTLDPDQYLLIWASDKDKQGKYFKTLIQQGDEFRYLIPNSELPQDWSSINFDDEDWLIGASGFGYSDGDDATILPEGTRSVFLRNTFEITDVDSIMDLYLDMDYDDGFAAYLNGELVAIENLSSLEFDATSITDREATLYNGGAPLRIDLSDRLSLLNEGDNVLSIQVHNLSSTSSDMTAIAYLTCVTSSAAQSGSIPPPVLDLPAQSIHANFKVSRSGETLALYHQQSQLIDSISTGQLSKNISIGRAQPNTDWKYFDQPTPKMRNTTPAYSGLLTSQPLFSHASGRVSDSTIVLITGNDHGELIRYTTDGSVPTESSQEYQQGITITENSVIRAKFFVDNALSTSTGDRSYFIDIDHDVPIISILTDPEDFFGTEGGIYALGDTYEYDFPFFGANFWDDKEIRVSVDYLSSVGELEYAFNAGTKIFGGWSRALDQKSLSLFARNTYDQAEFNYPFFASRSYSTFQSLLLRNTGNDFLIGNMRDVFMTSLLEGSGLDIQAYQPTATYINAQYWGLYFLREKINEHYLSSKHGVDPEAINLLENNANVKSGSANEFINLRSFIEGNDLSQMENYAVVEEQLNVENFIIYQIAQIYFGNNDWPGNNMRYWNAPNRKWEYLVYDTDFGFGIWNSESFWDNTLEFALQPDGPVWPNPPYSTLFLRKLIQNIEFRNRFVNRFADELNSRFLPQNIENHLNGLTLTLENEMAKQYTRWGQSIDVWYQNIQVIERYGNQRPQSVKQHLLSTLNLPDYHRLDLSIDDPQKGQVIINNRLTIEQQSWQGDYFEEVPFTLTAVANEGEVFSHWSGDISSQEEEILIDIDSPLSVQANFTPVSSTSAVSSPLPFTAYPNPFVDHITLNFESIQDMAYEVNLVESGGKVVRQLISSTHKDQTSYSISNLQSLKEGTYFLEIVAGNNVLSTIKLLKQ